MDFLVIKKRRPAISIHTFIMYMLFVLSCIHSITLLAWLIVIPIWSILKYGKQGAIEFLIFLQFRSLLSSGIASPFSGSLGLIKWAVVFGVSFYLLIGLSTMKRVDIYNIIMLVLLFSVFAILFAWISSSYPFTATFKVLSYCIPFIGIIKGVSDTNKKQWIVTINWILGILVFFSIVLLVSPIGYLRNGRSFQGVFNHPNVYAVMIAVFIAGYYYQVKKISIKSVLITMISIFLLYQTESRTGMISLMFIIMIFLITQEMKLGYKLLLIVVVIGGIGCILMSSGSVVSIIEEYLFKGNNTDILASRNGQIANNMERFRYSPLFGTGFNVPWKPYVRSYVLSFDLITENGNLFMALLGDVGILGFILFCITYLKIFMIGKSNMPTLFFVPFLVCMGEMSFFSTNNFAIILYFYFAIFMNDSYRNNVL